MGDCVDCGGHWADKTELSGVTMDSFLPAPDVPPPPCRDNKFWRRKGYHVEGPHDWVTILLNHFRTWGCLSCTRQGSHGDWIQLRHLGYCGVIDLGGGGERDFCGPSPSQAPGSFPLLSWYVFVLCVLCKLLGADKPPPFKAGRTAVPISLLEVSPPALPTLPGCHCLLSGLGPSFRRRTPTSSAAIG